METIDHTKHVMNIKTSDGKFETIDVPAGASRFNELKVGDKVSVTYNNNVSASEGAGRGDVDTGARPQPWDRRRAPETQRSCRGR